MAEWDPATRKALMEVAARQTSGEATNADLGYQCREQMGVLFYEKGTFQASQRDLLRMDCTKADEKCLTPAYFSHPGSSQEPLQPIAAHSCTKEVLDRDDADKYSFQA